MLFEIVPWYGNAINGSAVTQSHPPTVPLGSPPVTEPREVGHRDSRSVLAHIFQNLLVGMKAVHWFIRNEIQKNQEKLTLLYPIS